MWYRAAIDFGKLFGIEQPQQTNTPEPMEKPGVPDDVFKEVVRSNIPDPVNQIDHSKGDYHLILTGTGAIHQGSSHSNYIDKILDQSRKSLSDNQEITEKYNIRNLPDKAYGPMDYAERINSESGPDQPFLAQEDAVTEILHDYFDKGIRISHMGSMMTVNSAHVPTYTQMQKLFEIINLIQPANIRFKTNTGKGLFDKVYNINKAADYKNDIKEFEMHGKKIPSLMSQWRDY
jgi:hypothetical protein